MRRRLRSIQLSCLDIKVISGRTTIIGGRMTTMRIGLVRYNHGAQDIKSHSSIFQDLISVFVMSSYAA